MKQLDTSSIFRWLAFGSAVKSCLHLGLTGSDLGLTGTAGGVSGYTSLPTRNLGWKLTLQLAAGGQH